MLWTMYLALGAGILGLGYLLRGKVLLPVAPNQPAGLSPGQVAVGEDPTAAAVTIPTGLAVVQPPAHSLLTKIATAFLGVVYGALGLTNGPEAIRFFPVDGSQVTAKVAPQVDPVPAQANPVPPKVVDPVPAKATPKAPATAGGKAADELLTKLSKVDAVRGTCFNPRRSGAEVQFTSTKPILDEIGHTGKWKTILGKGLEAKGLKRQFIIEDIFSITHVMDRETGKIVRAHIEYKLILPESKDKKSGKVKYEAKTYDLTAFSLESPTLEDSELMAWYGDWDLFAGMYLGSEGQAMARYNSQPRATFSSPLPPPVVIPNLGKKTDDDE